MVSHSKEILRELYKRIAKIERQLEIVEAHDVGVRNKYNAIAGPGTIRNRSQGYTIGSTWIVPNVGVWRCIFSNQTTATWVQISP